MKTITLKLDSKTITLSTHEVQGKQLFKAQDLLSGYYNDKKQAANKMSNWKIANKVILGNQVVNNNGGNAQGTYLPAELIYALASSISTEFMLAVMIAFKHLVNGEIEKSVAVSESVVTVHDIMTKRNKLNDIRMHFKQSGKNIDSFVKSFLDAMDNNTKADLTDRKKTVKSLSTLVGECVLDAKNALIADIQENTTQCPKITGRLAVAVNAKARLDRYLVTKIGQSKSLKITALEKELKKLTK